MSFRFALIPAYEPDNHLTDLTEKLLAEGFRVIVIDDGSGPAYTHIFQNLPEGVVVLTHCANSGKGAALKTGLTWLANSCDDSDYTVVTLDADGQHLPKDALRVCRAAEEAPDALVLGVRRFHGNIPFRSRLGNGFTRLTFRLVSGVNVCDTQTGLRAFSSRFTKQMLAIPGERYEYEMNVLLACARRRCRIVQLPIETVYLDGNSSSHFSPLRDSFRIYRNLFRFRGRFDAEVKA